MKTLVLLRYENSNVQQYPYRLHKYRKIKVLVLR